MGTDIGGYGFGETALELELLVEAGMTPAEAIEVSTRRSAECLRIDGLTGTLEAGKRADLLVVDGDPLADITVLRRRESLALVMKDGAELPSKHSYYFSYRIGRSRPQCCITSAFPSISRRSPRKRT